MPDIARAAAWLVLPAPLGAHAARPSATDSGFERSAGPQAEPPPGGRSGRSPLL
jgi:hypothetical protein